MIEQDEALELLLRQIPEFAPAWERYLQSLQADIAEPEVDESAARRTPAITSCTYMMAFTEFVTELIGLGKFETFPRIFELTEHLMVHGDQTVQDGVATCFLENLINLASHGCFSASSFVGYLGPESRKFCRAWDEFCGAKTPGL